MTEARIPKCVQRAKDRIAGLFARGCENQKPRDHLKELDSWFIALARLVGTSEVVSTTISICEGMMTEGSLADSKVVAGWLGSIGDINPGSKKPRGKKGRVGRDPHSPNGQGVATERAPDPSPGGAGSRPPALVCATVAGRLWGRFPRETVIATASYFILPNGHKPVGSEVVFACCTAAVRVILYSQLLVESWSRLQGHSFRMWHDAPRDKVRSLFSSCCCPCFPAFWVSVPRWFVVLA